MAADPPPYWVLISILFTAIPMTSELAMKLHASAFELYRSDESALLLREEALQGEVRNLRRVFHLGAVTGHGFEARLDTARGSGVVRFLLTQRGMELLAQQQPPESIN